MKLCESPTTTYLSDATLAAGQKNIDMAVVLAESRVRLSRRKARRRFDDRQWRHLYSAKLSCSCVRGARFAAHKESFLKGIDYLFKAQYANGGWPPVNYPRLTGYYKAHHLQ